MRTGCGGRAWTACRRFWRVLPRRSASARNASSRDRSMTAPDRRETLILEFARDPVIAHQTLFKARHPDATPPFHDELIEAWHSAAPKVLALAFRGGGKSTLAEEAIALAAAMKL